ncbi:hypothetical protein [Nostocoides vanveenii]|jgi:hypothetical protein|uniref:Uncharacterized protein n=1 Tax=Nostocoides vanveenii TaxID=330835 RepID=A0ABN2K0Y8_9MICO
MIEDQKPGIEEIKAALDVAGAMTPVVALPHLRAAADLLARLIDDALAAAVLDEGASLRGAGAAAGLTENAVGPRLARTARLAGYANDAGRVTADAIRRAQYDAETGTPAPAAPPTPAPMRFKPRRPTTEGAP